MRLTPQTIRKRRRHLPRPTTWTGVYTLVGPDGKRHTIRNLARFCKRDGLTAARLYDVAGGRAASHRGWRAWRVG